MTPLLNYFRTKGVGGVTADCEARTGAGRMRFRYHGALIYNECRSGRALGDWSALAWEGFRRDGKDRVHGDGTLVDIVFNECSSGIVTELP